MVERCSRNSKTKCKPCGDREFNPMYTNDKCRDCTVCETGSITEKVCTKTSDAICSCPKGSISLNSKNTACVCKIGHQIVEKECVPCPPGYFSNKENGVCRPWTNCSNIGEELMEKGSSTTDTKCMKLNSLPSQLPPNAIKTKSPDKRAVTVSPPLSSTMDVITTHKTTVPGNSVNWGSLPLIVIGVILLTASAGIILMMVIQMNKKKKNTRFERNRCRIPVQEVSSSSDPSLDKQYSALDIA
ncbi:tumor necrosis factor receptor superfamily member 4 [Bombina bombina]|uniref:tumor necrosis factor receptor superfamily member 4 n=1 Tax=Bombina bombina TaxID=8345 RepID=UPI00235AE4FA|nr:tumor necrosis factor receptor superfamily member 4 [Bombina bombina]